MTRLLAEVKGVGVVLAQDAAAAGQGVFAQLPGRLPAADPQQADGQVVGRGQGIGMVLAQDAATASQGVSPSSRAAWCSMTARRLMARP